jgi:hypothetical protein
VNGARYGALFVLFGLANVEQREVIESRGDVVWVNLCDLSLGGVQ